MGAQAPQWLLDSFLESLQQIGAEASREQLSEEARTLADRWASPERHFHTLKYLITMLNRIDELASMTHDPDILRVATWYYGAFLNRATEIKVAALTGQKERTRCINYAHAHLRALGVSEEVAARVDELIAFLTRHRAPRGDLDGQVLVDADLAMLAAPPQECKQIRSALREELSDLDDFTFLKARRAFVKKILSFDPIYQSPLGDSWESIARANLEMELSRLDEALSKLDPTSLHDDTSDDSEDDEASDDAPNQDTTCTGTLIIKKRSLKKCSSTITDAEDMKSCEIPVLQPVSHTASEKQNSSDTISSLESAIEFIDLPEERR